MSDLCVYMRDVISVFNSEIEVSLMFCALMLFLCSILCLMCSGSSLRVECILPFGMFVVCFVFVCMENDVCENGVCSVYVWWWLDIRENSIRVCSELCPVCFPIVRVCFVVVCIWCVC